MSKYIKYGIINNNEGNFQKAKIKELKHFIRENIVDEEVKEKFPLIDLGDSESYLEVIGSRELIDLFEQIDNKKIDLPEKLSNIKYNGISEDGEIILQFENGIIATGVYDFTYHFFDELFEMGKYARFCINNNLMDLLEENIHKLRIRFKDKENQYRLIEKDNEWLLRGITSPLYNNYDNHIVIYLVLFLLNRLSIKENIDISLKSAYISDSSMRIFFEQDNCFNVEGVGNVYFGILVTNGEIRNSGFSAEIYYTIVDENNEDVRFTAIQDIKDSIFNIKHNIKVDTLISKVQNISNLLAIEKEMLSYIKAIKDIKTVSDDLIYSLMLKITKSKQALTSETKKGFKQIYDENLINNSMSLLEVFNKITLITTDIDERIYLQRIYNEVIKEVLSHS